MGNSKWKKLFPFFSVLLLVLCPCFFGNNGPTTATPARSQDTINPAANECEHTQPDWVFCCSFEEGNLDIWDDWDQNPAETNLLMEDPGPFSLENNHVVRLRVPPGRGSADLVKVLDDSFDRLFVRWYVMWEEGYDFGALNHGGGLHAGERSFMGQSDYRPDGSDWFSSWIEPRPDSHRLNAYTYYRGMYQNCIDPMGACWGDEFPCMVDEGEIFCTERQHRDTIPPPVMKVNQWYCIEMMMDAGTPVSDPASADGLLNFWIDGQEFGPWDDLWLRTTEDLKLTILWLNLFHAEDHSIPGLYLDNVVVSTTRIGCGHVSSVDPESRSTEPSRWDALKSRFR
jgi:hypothetical protein